METDKKFEALRRRIKEHQASKAALKMSPEKRERFIAKLKEAKANPL